MKANNGIVLIGTGNLAFHLAPALENVGYRVTQVYGRDLNKAKQISRLLYSGTPTSSLDFSNSTAALFIVAVSDDAIEDVAKNIVLPHDSILVHTSGSVPMSALDYAAASATGVLWPLQTFTKSKKIDFSNIPICIEYDDLAQENLTRCANALTQNVIHVTSEKRKHIHLAAVLACNFTNHMMAEAQILLKDLDLNFKILEPLLAETFRKAIEIGPIDAQTGPAARGDSSTIQNHLQLIENDPELSQLYSLLTARIGQLSKNS